MLIGQLARQAGVNVETVRYYERRGLLPRPQRTPSGYRHYHPHAVARLQFIKRAQGLGFSLQDIEELLALRGQPKAACDAVDRKTQDKISLIRDRIRELEAMERTLVQLVAACDRNGSVDDCAILHELDAACATP